MKTVKIYQVAHHADYADSDKFFTNLRDAKQYASELARAYKMDDETLAESRRRVTLDVREVTLTPDGVCLALEMIPHR